MGWQLAMVLKKAAGGDLGKTKEPFFVPLKATTASRGESRNRSQKTEALREARQ